ncbi:MAG: ribonuclease P protein component [Prevotella sp.]|nr:ribonuclease P protein component [Prevotella sp.]
MNPLSATLSKGERLCSQRLTEQLFGGVNRHSMAFFPLRLVWMETERAEGAPPAQLLISVPKRRLKHAVARNRVKRQIREAYRQAKATLYERLEATPGRTVLLAFIWQADELYSTKEVDQHVGRLLQRLTEKI